MQRFELEKKVNGYLEPKREVCFSRKLMEEKEILLVINLLLGL